MLCDTNACACGITSSSLVITGSGASGDPWVIDTNAFSVVTSATHPAGPSVGQSILETDTKRYLYWDGVNWVIMGGQMPGCTAYITGGSQSVNDNSTTGIALATEMYDIGGLHASTNAFYTIPAGMAGDYRMSAILRFASNIVGPRTTIIAVSSNGSIVNPALVVTDYPDVAGSNHATSLSSTVRLVAGAVVTLEGFQASGGALTVTHASMSVDMVRHIPSLV